MAVFPSLEVCRLALESIRQAAHQLGDRVRWTRPENVHLTLKFLGEVPETKLDDIRPALRNACANHTAFDATLDSFGAFPSPRRARVIWAGVGVGSERLRALAADVEAALEPLGFEREGRDYVPHATLGRARSRPVKVGLPEPVPGEPGFKVARVELVESRLTAEGAVYETLESMGLQPG